MKKFPVLFLLLIGVATHNAMADDVDCVRNNCLGTCISKEEALHGHRPMVCKPQRVCYEDVECMKLDNGKCGWKETPEMKACLAEKAKGMK